MKRSWWWILATLPLKGPVAWIIFVVVGGDAAIQIVSSLATALTMAIKILLVLIAFTLVVLIPLVLGLAVTDAFTRKGRARGLLAALADACMAVVERVRRSTTNR